MTQTQKTILILLILSLFLGLVGYFVIFPEKVGLCFNSYSIDGEIRGCLSEYSFSVGEPLYASFRFLAAIFLLLFFLPQTFTAWKKFAVWFIPLAALLIILAPTYTSGIDPTPTKEMLSWWLGWAYLGLSALIIAVSAIRSRKA